MPKLIDDFKSSTPQSPSVATPVGSNGLRGQVMGVTRIGSRAGIIAIGSLAALVLGIFYGISSSGNHPATTVSVAPPPQVLATGAPPFEGIPGAVPTAAPAVSRPAVPRVATQAGGSRSAAQAGTQAPITLPAQPPSGSDQRAPQNALQNVQEVPDIRPVAQAQTQTQTQMLQAATVNAAAQLKLEQRQRALALEQAARQAAILVGGRSDLAAAGGPAPANPSAATVPDNAAAQAANAAGPAANAAGPAANAAGTTANAAGTTANASATAASAAQPTYDPNVYAQRAKNEFLQTQQSTTGSDYQTAPRQAAISPYEVQAGSIIPATLVTGINSDLPGTMIGQVNQNVYDSKTGRFLLIPAGSKIVGRYDSQVANGQSRVLVAWQRIIYPDASFIDINGMAGADTAGYSGLTGKVDDHSGKLFRNALLMSLIGAGSALLQPRTLITMATPVGMVVAAPSVGAQVAGAVGTQVGQTLSQAANNNQQQAPTIEVRPGYLFNVVVSRDLVLPGPYKG